MHYHKKQRKVRAPREGHTQRENIAQRKGCSHQDRSHRAKEEELFLSALSGMDVEEGSIHRDSADRRNHHKTQMLCRQVMRALSLSLAGECGDEILRELWVQSVQPCGGTGHLRVLICVPRDVPVAQVMEQLDRHSGRLRLAVARAIRRKRTPQLIFLPVGAIPLEQEDGQ